MTYTLRIKRQENRQSEPYWQEFEVQPPPRGTVAWALDEINGRMPLEDTSGNDAEPVGWSCSCAQKLCGACAMVVNGKPMLACACFLEEYPAQKPVVVEPLTKFPVIRDLAVDKTLLEENMIYIKAWLAGDANKQPRHAELLYQISQCTLCGCCYEACPNCLPNGDFVGPPSIYSAYRAMLQDSDASHGKEIKKGLRDYGKAHCSKAMACDKVCPAEIHISSTLVRI